MTRPPKLNVRFSVTSYRTSGKTAGSDAPCLYCKNIDGSIVYKRKIMNVKVDGEFTCDRLPHIHSYSANIPN